MSQQDFAVKLGLSPASLSSIFTGRTNPTNNHVQAIHKAFPNINVSWLLFGEGDMLLGGSDNVSTSADQDAATENSAPSLFSQPAASPQSSSSPSGSENLTSVPMGPAASVSSPKTPYPQHFPQQGMGRTVETVKIVDKVVRKIREIRVFYDDGTYETFIPSSK